MTDRLTCSSDTVGNRIKMEDFNCDKIIDRAVYSDRMHSTEPSVKDDTM